MRGGWIAGLLAAGLVAAGVGAAPPPQGTGPKLPTGPGKLPTPSLLRSYTVQLYDMPQGTFVAQFDPAKGQLRSISAKLGGIVRYTLTLAGPPAPSGDYAFTAYAPAYVFGGNAWFDLKATGTGTFAGGPTQEIGGQASGAGAVMGSNTARMFTGGGTVRLVLTPDLPQFTAGKAAIKTVEKGQASLSGSVTYTYLPALKPIVYKPK